MEATGSPGKARAAEGSTENTGGSPEMKGKAPDSDNAQQASPGVDSTYRYDEYDDYIPWEI